MENGFNIKIQNVVAFTALGVTVKLDEILKKVENTEWQPEQFPGLVYRMTNPRAAALIFSQGKIVCTGTKSLEDANIAMGNVVKKLKETGIDTPKKYDIIVENIVASTKIDATIDLENVALKLENSEYEPEQFPGLVYRIKEPRVAFLLFNSGRIICTGARNTESIHVALIKFKKDLESIGMTVVPDKNS